MQALREIVKVKNHQIKINLPEYYRDNEELEVIVLSREIPNKTEKDDVLSVIFMKDCGEFLQKVNRDNIYDGER